MNSWERQTSKRLGSIASLLCEIRDLVRKTRSNQLRTKELLDRAHEIRKFEIELYWKRTTYFWTLIAAAFVAYFAIQSANGLHKPSRQTLAFIVANLGFVFSLGWYFVNKGSKFWQENWEAQVDRLEKCLKEKFYRLYSTRKNLDEEKRWLGPAPYSVSKINLIISLYTIFIWIFFCFWSLVQLLMLLNFHCFLLRSIGILSVLVFFLMASIAACYCFGCEAKTDLNGYKRLLHERSVEFKKP